MILALDKTYMGPVVGNIELNCTSLLIFDMQAYIHHNRVVEIKQHKADKSFYKVNVWLTELCIWDKFKNKC